MRSEPNPLFKDYPNAAFNTFLMMRFADCAPNRKIVNSLRTVLHRYALNLLRAEEKAYTDSLWTNVRNYLDKCDLGIAVFEQLIKKAYNPNVNLELGYM